LGTFANSWCSKLIKLFASRDNDGSSNKFRDRLELISRFAQQISSELKVLTSLTEEIQNSKDQFATQHKLERLSAQIEFLRYQLKNYCMLAEEESLEGIVLETPFDIRVIVDEVVFHFDELADRTGLQLSCIKDSELPNALLGDPAKIKQILFHIVSNAVKYTESGDIVVSSTVEQVDGENYWVKLVVSDTGPGFDGEVPEQLFEPFYRGKNSDPDTHQGIGLGLAICRELAYAIGGEIKLSRNGYGGTSVDLLLPLSKADEKEVEQGDTNPLGKIVYVIGELDVNRDTIVEAVSSWGFDVRSTSEFRIEEEKINSILGDVGSVDVCIVDISLSFSVDRTFEMIKELKKLKKFSNTRFVFLTTEGHPGDSEKAKQSGVNCYLTKPVNKSEFKCCVMDLANKKDSKTDFLTKYKIKEKVYATEFKVLIVSEDENYSRALSQSLYKRGVIVDLSKSLDFDALDEYDLCLVDEAGISDLEDLKNWARQNGSAEANLDKIIIIKSENSGDNYEKHLNLLSKDAAIAMISDNIQEHLTSRWNNPSNG